MTRRAAVVKVQIARKELGLDEDTYRAMLERITGLTSSADCTDDQLGDVLDEMKAKGWSQDVSGYPPRTDLVKVLKAGLIRAQEKRLGRPRSPENYMRRLHPELDRVIREQGAEIHALQARAG